jgi:hypothetical protein
MMGELVRRFSRKSMFNTRYCINEVLLLNVGADNTRMLGATSEVAVLLPSVNS